MTIHRENVGFTFRPINEFPKFMAVDIHFDGGPLNGLQLAPLYMQETIDGDDQLVVPSSVLTAPLGEASQEAFCNAVWSAFDEYRSLSAADPSAEGFPLSAYAGRELPRV